MSKRNKRASRSRQSAASPARGPAARAKSWLPAAAAVALGAGVYLGTLDHPFVYDDIPGIVDNESIRYLGRADKLGWILRYSPFRPLVNLSFAVDHAIWGLDPFGYHLTSLLLHAVVVGALFFFARGLFPPARDGVTVWDGTWGPAFAVAAIFAVHPITTEAVGYASGRSEVLCGAFFLGALLAFRGWAMKPAVSRWLATVGLFAAAALSREVGATWPVVAVLYDRLVLCAAGPDGDRDGWRHRWRRLHLPLLSLVAAGAVLRLWRFLVFETAELPRPVWQNVMSEWEVVWRYVGLLFAPVGQSIVHPAQRVASPLDVGALTAGVGSAGLVAFAWWVRRRLPEVSLGTAWLLLVLAPSSSLIPLNELMAEHRVYLAAVGWTIAVVAAAVAGSRRLPAERRWILRAALVVVLAVLGAATVVRNRVWADRLTLWRDAARKAPRTWRAVWGLAEAQRATGGCEAAVETYLEAARLLPEDRHTQETLGLCLAQVGRHREAEAVFGGMIARDPRDRPAIDYLAQVALVTGRPDLAIELSRRALALDSADVHARVNLVNALRASGGDPDEIRRLCGEIRELAPDTPGIDSCAGS